MQSHPSFPLLEPFLSPAQGGPLFLVYNDLVHSQKWASVEPHHLASAAAAAADPALPASFLIAYRKLDERPRVIVPLALNAPLSPRWFKTTFAALFASPAYISSNLPLPPPPDKPVPGTQGELDPPVLYTAIVQKDSSVVYYRIAKGVEKPHDVPE